MTRLFRGTGTALATPFHQDGSIDFDSFGRLIDFQIDNGIEALIACGSTGESATMTRDERLAVILFTVERVGSRTGGKPLVIAGTGSNVTDETISMTRAAAELGIDGALLVSPYYNKPSQRGLIDHFGAIAEAVSELPLILYNVPSRTGSNITAQTTLQLAQTHLNIIAIKEASADLDQCSEIMRDAPDGFVLYSGEDSLTQPLISMGAAGVIAVVSNEVPKEFGDMVRHALDGRTADARMLHMQLFELMRANFIESNPGPVKEALHMMGIFATATLRRPLVALSETNRETLRGVLERRGLLEEPVASAH
ncbi:MAG: 4-hydroxy-tetrahydrodipicolinate synthase [bacterium]|nr:4-hydroxy-tetrahydrodipicolinate synthase [Candidatus Kapabacteria bacterium]